MNHTNLTTLANYLDNLPPDYPNFDMWHYYSTYSSKNAVQYALHNGGVDQWDCGSVACAVGHGPAAGMLIIEDEIIEGEPNWPTYCCRVFGIHTADVAFDFLL